MVQNLLSFLATLFRLTFCFSEEINTGGNGGKSVNYQISVMLVKNSSSMIPVGHNFSLTGRERPVPVTFHQKPSVID